MESTFGPGQEQPPAPSKHSGLGITSFILGLLCVLGYVGTFFGLVAVIYNLYYSVGHVPTAEDITAQGGGILLLVLLIILIFVINVVGLILGIVGWALKNRKKAFSITGTIINSVLILTLILLWVAGIMRQA